MSDELHLNGSDYLMLGFDHELRRRGFAGNSCQIVLELDRAISPATLRQRLETIADRHPVLRARPAGLLRPGWKPLGRGAEGPRVRVHGGESASGRRFFNERLAVNRGELLRFDLIERAGGGMTLIFTWAHALMDANGAEHFLAALGHEEPPLSAPPAAQPAQAKPPLKDRLKLAWKYLHHLDDYCAAPPRCLGRRRPNAPARLEYRVEAFSPEETERVRANGARRCGVLGDAQYHAAVSVVELHRLHQRLNLPSPSYVLPVPVGLRLKGGVAPLISNQISMLLFQFLPGQLGSVAEAVGALKTQTAQAMREGLLDSGRMLSELFRFLPLPAYMAMVKHGLRGEICSLFYGDTAAVTPQLANFFRSKVNEFTHVAAVTPSPGLGVLFYYFRDELRVTIVHSDQVLADQEAAEFAASLRERLLNP